MLPGSKVAACCKESAHTRPASGSLAPEPFMLAVKALCNSPIVNQRRPTELLTTGCRLQGQICVHAFCTMARPRVQPSWEQPERWVGCCVCVCISSWPAVSNILHLSTCTRGCACNGQGAREGRPGRGWKNTY